LVKHTHKFLISLLYLGVYLKSREVLVHRPGKELKIVTLPQRWLFNDYIDPVEMEREHDKLVKALQDQGVTVHYLTRSMDNKPKLYMVRDNAVISDRKAVTCHSIYSVRRGEEQIVKMRLKELGVKIAGHIFVPGFLQGSDIFFMDKNHAIAIIGRETNKQAIEHLMNMLKIDVIPMEMENLTNTKFNLVNDTAVISEDLTYGPLFDLLKEREYDIVIATSEQTRNMAVNFIQIDDYRIVNVKSDLNEKLKMIGYDVIELELRELLKGNCGIRGLVLPFY